MLQLEEEMACESNSSPFTLGYTSNEQITATRAGLKSAAVFDAEEKIREKEIDALERQRRVEIWLNHEVKTVRATWTSNSESTECGLLQEEKRRHITREQMKKRTKTKNESFLQTKEDIIEQHHQEQMQQQKKIDDYIENGTEIPEILLQVNHSRPNVKLCQFFERTGICKYGDFCCMNHRKILYSKVILIRGFFSQFFRSRSYVADAYEIFGGEIFLSKWDEYQILFYKMIKELELFGDVKTFTCCYNLQQHMHGNLYVEYNTEREAIRAWRNLHGRWYGTGELNCKLVYLQSLKDAVCNKMYCTKSLTNCDFIHTLPNPQRMYDVERPDDKILLCEL